jgi:hypothetical protein
VPAHDTDAALQLLGVTHACIPPSFRAQQQVLAAAGYRFAFTAGRIICFAAVSPSA